MIKGNIIMTYKNKTSKCAMCEHRDTLEHKLFHQTGFSECKIRKLKLKSVEEIEKAFSESTRQSECFILVRGEKVQFKVEDRYLLPKKLIDLIKL